MSAGGRRPPLSRGFQGAMPRRPGAAESPLGCGHHTDAERIAKARETGAKDVVANSALESRLLELMS